MLRKLNQFANELYVAVTNGDVSKYNYITETLRTFFGTMIEEGLRKQTMNSQTLIEYIKQFDVVHYKSTTELEQLTNYVNGYVNSLTEVKTGFSSKCNKCGTIADFDNEEQYTNDNKICGYVLNGSKCDGQLEVTNG